MTNSILLKKVLLSMTPKPTFYATAQ